MATNALEIEKSRLESLQSSQSSSASNPVKRNDSEKAASKSHSSRPKNHSQTSTMGASQDQSQNKKEQKQLRNHQDKEIKRLNVANAKLDTDNVALGKTNGSLLTQVNALTEQSGKTVAANLSLSEDKRTLEGEKEALMNVVDDLTEKDKVSQERIMDLEGGMEEDSPGLTVDLKRELSSLNDNMVELTANYNDVVK